MPYQIKKFSRSTGNFELPPQRSVDSLPLGGNPAQSPLPHQQSFDLHSVTPPQDPYTPPRNDSPAINFSPSPGPTGQGHTVPLLRSNDTASNNLAAPSPHGHFSRHSINDFSNFNWGNNNLSSSLVPEQPLASAVSETFPADWHDYGLNDPVTVNDFSGPPAQRTSIVSSVDHPGLSHSPSASASDTGESIINYSDNSYSSNMLRPPVTIDPNWTMKDLTESPATDFANSAFSAVSNPYIYGVNEAFNPGMDDFMGGPGPTTTPQEMKQDMEGSNQFPPTPYIREPGDNNIIVPQFINYQSPDQWDGNMPTPGFNDAAEFSSQSPEMSNNYGNNYGNTI